MHRTDNRKRPDEHFSILVVPRNRSNIRRIEFSMRKFQLVVASLIAVVTIVLTGFISLAHYYNAYNTTEAVRVEAADFARERAALLGRVAALEGALARTERFAAKMEASLEEGSEKFSGTGPIESRDWLPASEKGSLTASIKPGSWRSPFAKTFTAGLNLTIDELSERTGAVEERLHKVFSNQQDRLFFWASLPSIWPARGWVTSGFGARRGWGGHKRRHEGIDIAGPRGTPIVAPGDGIVTFTGYRGGYGKTLMIDHGYGISTLYGHCQSLYAQEGQRVKRGMIVAAVGNTGYSTGPHLHYEIQVDGVPVDPMLYIMASN